MVQEIHLFSRLDRKQLTSIKEVEPQEKKFRNLPTPQFSLPVNSQTINQRKFPGKFLLSLLPVLVCSSCPKKNIRLGDLNSRNLFFHCVGSWKSQIKVSLCLVLPGVPLFDLQMAVFSLCPHMTFSPFASLLSLTLLIKTPALLD